MTISLVGEVAVKSAGSGAGNAGAEAAGAGGGHWRAGAAGTCVCAMAWIKGREKQGQRSCSWPNERTDESSEFLLQWREDSQPLAYTCDFDGDGKPAAHAEGLGGDLQDRGGLLAFVLRALHQAHHLLDEFEGKSVCFCAMHSGVS